MPSTRFRCSSHCGCSNVNSENVSWIVMRNAATIPGSLIKDIKEHAEQHPRALQPLDRRLVVRSFVDKAEKG